MIRTATLVDDPRQVKGSDDVQRWRARCRDNLTGYFLDAQISLRAGEWFPFRTGDTVLIALPYGSTQGAEILGHKGLQGVTPTSASNIELRARRDAEDEPTNVRVLAPGGRVDLGEGEPDDQQQVAMHPKIAAELEALKGALDAMARFIDGLTSSPTGGSLIPNPANVGQGALPGVPIVTAALAIQDGLDNEAITGGNPATNVYALPDTDTE